MRKWIVALEKLKLSTKMLFGFGAGLLIALLVGVTAIRSMSEMSDQVRNLYEKDLLGIAHIKEANVNLILMGRSLRQMMLAPDAEGREKARVTIDRASASLKAEMTEARKTIFREENIKLLRTFEIQFDQYTRNVSRAIALLEKEGFRASEAVAYISSAEFMNVINGADQTMDMISKGKQEGARKTVEAMEELAKKSRTLSLSLLLAGLFLGGIIGIMMGASIKRPSNRLLASVEGLADGKLDETIPHTEYRNEIGAMARGIQILQNVCRGMDNEKWIKTHVAEIASRLQHAEDYSGLAREFLSAACPLLKAGLGVIYRHEENGLQMLGAYGWRERKHLNLNLALGEGLLGQSAIEKQPITITNPPEDYVKIGSALGEATPRVVAVLPIMQVGQLLGMLELASFQPIGERENALLDALIPVLATSMQLLERNLAARQLMKEAQARAEQMEAQAAQLEEQSVEMEAQQAELLKTEGWYRSIVEAANAMLVVDQQGLIALCNPRADAVFGYTAGELSGRRADSLLPSWARAEANVGLAASEDPPKKNTMMSMNVLRKDGSEVAVEVVLNRLPELGEKGACMCVSIRDLAECRETPAN